MPKYINTTGNDPLSIAVCPRCKMKRAYVDFVVDPDTQQRVCHFGCADLKDPYRLPSRKGENISIKYPRPDEDIVNPDPPYDPA